MSIFNRLIHELKRSNNILDIDVRHEFEDGYYIRTMICKKGVCLVGKKHRQATLNVLKFGACIVKSEFRTLGCEGYHVFTSLENEQKSFYFLQDSEFSTYHKIDQTADLELIENSLVYSAIPEKNIRRDFI